MNNVLVIKSSISPQKSVTNRALDIFVENYKLMNPNDNIEILDLNNLKTLKILTSNNFEAFFGDEADKLIDQLKSANKIIISAGMVNFNVPPSLKCYFDSVLQANKTFKYKYKGKGESMGLLDPNVKVQLILAQGATLGWYPFAFFDKYLEGVLNFIGITNISKIIYDGTKTEEKSSLSVDEIIDKNVLIKLSANF